MPFHYIWWLEKLLILYTVYTVILNTLSLEARKSDIWIAVDPLTGTKLHSFSSDGMSSLTCPVPDTDGRALYIARTGECLLCVPLIK